MDREEQQDEDVWRDALADSDGRVQFYYSREHRLSRASQAVRELNEGGVPQKRGLFRTLTATKPLRLSFISIVAICVIMILYSLVAGRGAVAAAGGVEIRIQAFEAGDTSYITVKKTVKSSDPYTGAVDLALSTGTEGQVYTERLYFTLEKEETFRFAVPFTGKKLAALAVLDEERALFRITSRKR